MPEINKISYTMAQLESMGPENLSLALLLGLFLNEANWLQKLLLIATLDEDGNDPEQRARLSLSLMLAKILAAKIHGGWMRMTQGVHGQTLISLDLPPIAKEARTKLEALLAKNSIIHEVRNQHVGHYPVDLSLERLKGINEADLVMFMTNYSVTVR